MKNGSHGPHKRNTLNGDDFDMDRLAATSAAALAHNRALMDAGLTWAADWRTRGKRFTRHNDGQRH